MSLDEAFFRALSDHPVPLLEGAIRQLKDRSMSLDIYVWLAYRLHALARPTAVGWASLHAQFGNGFRHIRQFRPYFLDALATAAAAYPDVRVDVGKGGITLRPSRPPVPQLA